MLASYLNTKLRDFYPDLSALCEEEGLDEAEIVERLKAGGFYYDGDINRIRAC